MMLAQLSRQRGEGSRAADYFESAGQVEAAAELRNELGDYVRAAKLYMQAELPLKAAEMYRAANDLVQAGDAYEVALDFEQAVECFREANAGSKWISALEKTAATFEAAKVALEQGQRPRAIRLLQCIAPEDEDFAEASWMLAAAFEREEHWDLAAQKLEQHIATYPLGTAPPDKYSRMADLYEQAGSYERALEVLEDLRRREPTYPGVASRIEHLHKQRSAENRFARVSDNITSGDAATAFVSEYRYEIMEEIGRGGMGVVFKARDRRLDRVVALKRLLEDLRRHQSRAVQLFLREAQSAARLNHPNIVTVYDTDQEDGVFFITMELLEGEPFHKILKEQGRLSPMSTVTVGMQVASGLSYAHEQGIVHRDVKTANLFLTTDKVVKIMDFGLAKMFEEVRGATTIISGTPFYMSPEQIAGGDVDQRTDLYSLGVTLFELSTGVVPFSQGDIAYHHRHADPPDPRTLVPDMQPLLAETLLKLLEKDPADRFASAAELLQRFEVLGGQLDGEI
jgi:serine/threonine-protein kinase